MAQINDLENINLTKPLEECGFYVERQARLTCPMNTGNLVDSIQSRVEGNIAFVGTNVFYAPYVEFGTGIYAGTGKYGEGYRGKGRQGWWVYVDAKCNAPKSETRTIWTYEQAKRIYARLVSKYGEGNVHMTQGQPPHPFLQPALLDHRKEIANLFAREVMKQVGGKE